MLHPTPLEGLIPKPWSQLRVEEHIPERDMCLPPEFVSLAADFYEVAHDADLDGLTVLTAHIDGAAANHLRESTHRFRRVKDLASPPCGSPSPAAACARLSPPASRAMY